MCSEEKIRNPSRKEIVCTAGGPTPSARNNGSSSALTTGSPIQPRPSEAMVMPSWQADR